MWSVLYTTNDGENMAYLIGPFKSKKKAVKAAKKAQKSDEFDINDQHVWLLDPKHRMIEFAISDLIKE